MSMFLYRDHRGSLDDSMATTVTMNSFEELKTHVISMFGEGNITVKWYSDDERISWNTHVVCHNDCAIGFTNQMVKE